MLLLDEPLGALDLKLRQEMQIELKRIQREVGITFVYVTHDQDEALSMSDRIAVFNGGRIEQVGTPAEVYERPATDFVAGFVGDLERDRARRPALIVRPEKIRCCRRRRAPAGAHEPARSVTSSTSAVTRYIVELDAGGELGRRAEPRSHPPATTRGPAGARSGRLAGRQTTRSQRGTRLTRHAAEGR